MQQKTLELITIAQSAISMSFLENLENEIFPEEAGNGELIQPALPLEPIVTKEQLEQYNERLKYMEDYGI